MKRLLAVVTSIRTTAALLAVLALLLLIGLLVPQRAVLGDATVSHVAQSRGAFGFLIDTLGFGSIAASPLFLATLALFYLNLIAVLVDRAPRTIARARVNPPVPEALERWIASPRALEGTARESIEGIVATTLRGFGFKPFRVTASSFYGVKHRYAAIGFLLFHVSFFFLCAGGLMIWYTRYVGETRAVEGQSIDANDARVLRMRRVGGAPDLTFTVEKIAPSFDRGEATDLRATLRLANGDAADAWVNHPVRQKEISILVTDVGIAPAFWLQDSNGFGLDRVAVPAGRREPVDVPLAGGTVRVRVEPDDFHGRFPLRDRLQTTPVKVILFDRGHEVFRGALRTGEAATFSGGRLVLSEVRYWAGLKIISERGGFLLVTGFVLATAGAVWRLLLRRRDVVIAWDGPHFRIAGHGEWFADRDRRELMNLCSALENYSSTRPAPGTSEVTA